MKHLILLALWVSLLQAGDIYAGYSLAKIDEIKRVNTVQNETNTTEKKLTADFFTKDYFTDIIRYAPIFFSGEQMDKESQKVFEKVLHDLNSSDMNRSRLTIIGHTAESIDVNNSVSTNGYVAFFQNVVTHEGNSPKNDYNLSKKRAQMVYEKLLDNNVSKDIMYITQRSGKDKLYTETIKKGRQLNNRVDIALYFIGDEDQDGVLDPDDKCPNTHKGLIVDKHGCSGSIILDVLFKLNSAEIEGENNNSIKDFAEFLIENRPYHAVIIGHTDSQGRAEYNKRLSKRRAQTVQERLVGYGVAVERLQSVGHGESEPLVTEAEVYKMQNRGKKDPVALSKEELDAIHATNRRIEAHYFLPLEPSIEQKKPQAPKLRYKPAPKKPKKRPPHLRFKAE